MADARSFQFCLALAVLLSLRGAHQWISVRLQTEQSETAPPDQSLSIFTGVFVIVWVGSAVVTVNAKLLGGKVYAVDDID